MKIKHCNKCKKEIKGKWYFITVWEESKDNDEAEKELEYCANCYKKIVW